MRAYTAPGGAGMRKSRPDQDLQDERINRITDQMWTGMWYKWEAKGEEGKRNIFLCGLCAPPLRLCVKPPGREIKKPLRRGLGQIFAIYETYIKQVLH
jgi:hypothetical protein